MIIVTHEMAFARDVASQVIFMDDGYILEQGRPEEVFDNPEQERTKQFYHHIHNYLFDARQMILYPIRGIKFAVRYFCIKIL